MNHTGSRLPLLLRLGAAGLCLIVAVAAVLPYMTFNPEYFNLATKRFALEPPFRQVALYLHAISGGVALSIGPFQFFERFRHRRPVFHRLCGLVYMACIVLGSVSAFIMAPGMVSGVSGESSLILLGILWLWTGWQGVANAIRGRVDQHRKWMIRNFSLTFAAVTLRLWLLLMLLLLWPSLGRHYGGDFGRMFIDAYSMIMWLSWVPNIVLAEWILRRQANHTTASACSSQQNGDAA